MHCLDWIKVGCWWMLWRIIQIGMEINPKSSALQATVQYQNLWARPAQSKSHKTKSKRWQNDIISDSLVFQSIPLWIIHSFVCLVLLLSRVHWKIEKKNMLSRKIIAGLVKSPKQAFSTYKTSTGLVGLAVDLDGRQNLINVSAQILDAVQVQVQS